MPHSPKRIVMKPIFAKLSALLALATVVVFSSGCGDSPGPAAPAAPTDFEASAEDFECLQSWERVGTLRVANPLGFLDEALALARNPVSGQRYPLGTILQIFPGEAMVKRGPDYDPENHNWEYFELDVSPGGTEIRVRGRDEVVNRFGGQCFGCHEASREFDFVCGDNGQCEALPIGEDFILQLQETDPRCNPEASR